MKMWFKLGALSCAILVSGCMSSKSLIDAGSGLEDVRAIHGEVGKTGEPPSTEQYQFARTQFLDSMTGLQSRLIGQQTSSAAKIKKGIVVVGVIAGVGGTVGSLVVDSDDTRATLAQVSAATAAVAGIVGLLPIGAAANKAGPAVDFLSAELPRFEERWPEQLDRPLTVGDFDSFVGDAEHIVGTAALLAR